MSILGVIGTQIISQNPISLRILDARVSDEVLLVPRFNLLVIIHVERRNTIGRKRQLIPKEQQ